MAQVFSILSNLEWGQEVEKEKIYDDGPQRIVIFRMPAGSEIKPHTNPGVVQLTVLTGKANLLVGDGSEKEATTGMTLIYEKGEMHGMKAIENTVLMADIVAH